MVSSKKQQPSSGLVLSAKDLFERERFEERIDAKLAGQIQQYKAFQKKKSIVDPSMLIADNISAVITEFIKEIEPILDELHQLKKREKEKEQERIQRILTLIDDINCVSDYQIKAELIALCDRIGKDTIAATKAAIKADKGHIPLGFVLRRGKTDRKLTGQDVYREEQEQKLEQTEHNLLGEFRALLRSGIRSPNEHRRLKEGIKRVLKLYEEQLDEFLNIEIDISLETARKLTRISHYLTFLKGIIREEEAPVQGIVPLIQQLESLQEKAKEFVYQDEVSLRNLLRAAEKFSYAEKVITQSKTESFEDSIKVVPVSIQNSIPSLYFYQEGVPPPLRGVVMMHGFSGEKRALMTLGKRLALQGFRVISLDMSSHGDNRERFHLGRNAEYFMEGVKWMRIQGVRSVGLLGHSLGASSAMLALAGYNSNIEETFYKLVDEARRIQKTPGQNQINMISKLYKRLKQLILSGLEERRRSAILRVDCAVLLAPPLGVQAAVSPKILKMIDMFKWKVPSTNLMPLKSLYKPLSWGILKVMNAQSQMQLGKNQLMHDVATKSGEFRHLSAVFSDYYDFLNYLREVNNPYEFMECLHYLCSVESSMSSHDPNQNDKKIEEHRFFAYYRDHIIRSVPKLVAFGDKDEMLHTANHSARNKLRDHFLDFGAAKILEYRDVSHTLITESRKVLGGSVLPVGSFEAGKLPDLHYNVFNFLNAYLPAGNLPGYAPVLRSTVNP